MIVSFGITDITLDDKPDSVNSAHDLWQRAVTEAEG
jgi:hypothetical protein